MSFRKFKQNKNRHEIEPDEIFLDSSNLPDFDKYQFEGTIEKPISQRAIIFLGGSFCLIAIFCLFKMYSLQVVNGQEFLAKSENNRLQQVPVFAERGVIFDRNNIELAWNISGGDQYEFSKRKYLEKDGLAHILGYLSYPKKDSSGFYYQYAHNGKDGTEKQYDDLLSGNGGVRIIETDVFQNIKSEHIIKPPQDGKNINLTIDSEVQSQLYGFIKNLAEEVGFQGGGGVIIDIDNGEVLALTSYPEYDSNILTSGANLSLINKYINNKNKPFLNRIISGLYTPGSTIKPFVAIGALQEKVINPSDKIMSTGSLIVQNPYYPDQQSIFKDWKAHGLVDIKDALAVSSNVYFYCVSGGCDEQEGIGISGIEKYARLFGLGETTNIDLPGEIDGVIPNPEWKKKTFPSDPDWRLGDTYHTAIGQYGFQITPLQLASATSVLVNGGKIIQPQILLDKEKIKLREVEMNINHNYYEIVKEGMRMAVTEGTAKGLNIPQVKIAAKTGTAELGTKKEKVNSWVTGFFPYENPRYSFTVVMEKGDRNNLVGALYVMRQLLEWVSVYKPEYIAF